MDNDTDVPTATAYYDPELVPDGEAEKWERIKAEGGWLYRNGKVLARIEPGQLLAGEPPQQEVPSLRDQILAELDAYSGVRREQVADAILDIVADWHDA